MIPVDESFMLAYVFFCGLDIDCGNVVIRDGHLSCTMNRTMVIGLFRIHYLQWLNL